jgi:hypothetical protein
MFDGPFDHHPPSLMAIMLGTLGTAVHLQPSTMFKLPPDGLFSNQKSQFG